ncbi:hypothetical protein SCOR_13865 [Sulfidibacter corallicola]|uniref:Uncharacterized protein n=1 Tax=Sulfidibacter corallicola TaxID=2818388 RepID=A0A8A4TLW6_SULCO|nr:hypothetical protein [Sulfidibacter corallicola]QTD47595.1 hypothetical protein J3U87_18545 [Sulfidibacter corallicola]
MITGFNTDVRHKSKVYHVQTEDKGRSNPKIESLVYVGGEILDSYQTSYEQKKSDLSEDEIMELLEAQHKRVIREIKTGHYDSPDDFPEDVLTHRELDELIIDYLNSEPPLDQLKLVVNGLSTLRARTDAALKVEARMVTAGDPVPDAHVRVKLMRKGMQTQDLGESHTDQTGQALVNVNLPDYTMGEAAVVVQGISEFGVAEQRYLLRH